MALGQAFLLVVIIAMVYRGDEILDLIGDASGMLAERIYEADVKGKIKDAVEQFKEGMEKRGGKE